MEEAIRDPIRELERKNELATYVGKAQTELQRREAVWWDKQLGREEAGEGVEVDAA